MTSPPTADAPPPPPWPGSRCTSDTVDPRIWFSDEPADVAEARSICVLCPVVGVCRQFGRRQAAGVWGGLTREQRDLAGLTLGEAEFCTVCGDLLPDGHSSSICSAACYRRKSISTRKQARVEISASRACERCECAIWPQSRSCLVCGHIVGAALPNRPWPPPTRLVSV